MIIGAMLGPVPVFVGAALMLAVAIASFVFFMRINKARKRAYDRKLAEYNKAIEQIKQRESEQQKKAVEQPKKVVQQPAKPVAKAPEITEELFPRRVQFMAPNGASYDIPIKDSFTIGRNPSCDFCVRNGTVAERHCKVHYANGVYTIEDLGSVAGTFFDGNRVPMKGSQEIKTGLLQMGKVTFFITIDEENKAG